MKLQISMGVKFSLSTDGIAHRCCDSDVIMTSLGYYQCKAIEIGKNTLKEKFVLK